MNIGEFFVTLGVKSDILKVKDFAKVIGDLPLEAGAAILAIGGIEYKLAQLAVQVIDTAVSFQAFTSQTGLSAQELQQWQIVAERANVSTESVTASIKALQRNMLQVRYGMGNAKPFMMLGLNTQGDPFQTLMRLRKIIHEVPRDYFNFWSSQAGVSEEMLKVLELSDEQFMKFANHIRGITPREEAVFLKFKETLKGFGQIIKDVFTRIMGEAIDVLNRLIGKFIEVPKALLPLSLILYTLFPQITTLAAAITVLLLLFDDLYSYFIGDDSMTGRGIEGLKKLAEEVANVFKGIPTGALNLLGSVAGMIPGGLPIAATAGVIGGGAQNIINVVIHATDDAKTIARLVGEEISKIVGHTQQNINNQGAK